MNKVLFYIFVLLAFLTPLFYLPFTIDWYSTPKELLIRLGILIGMLLWLQDILNKNKVQIVTTRFYIFLFGYLIFIGTSLIWAENLYFATNALFSNLMLFMAIFLCANSFTQKQIINILKFFFASGVLSLLIMLLNNNLPHLAKNLPLDISRLRIYPTFASRSGLSAYLVLIFPVGVSLYLNSKRTFFKALYVTSLAIIFYFLLRDFSWAFICLIAGAFLGVVIFIYDLFRAKGYFLNKKILPTIRLALLLLCIILLLSSLIYLTLNIPKTYHISSSAKIKSIGKTLLKDRVITYKTALKMLKENPILGVGIGNFVYKYPLYRAQYLSLQYKMKSNEQVPYDVGLKEKATNIYLTIITELGIVGLFLFLLIIFSIFKHLLWLVYFSGDDFKKKSIAIGLLGSLSGFLLLSVINPTFSDPATRWAFWVMGGMVFSMLPDKKRLKEAIEFSNIKRTIVGCCSTAIILFLCIWAIRTYLGEIYLKRTIEYDKKGNYSRAYIEAKRSLFFDRNNKALIYAGKYAKMYNNNEDAMKFYMKAIKNYNYITLHLALADVYYEEKLIKDCIDEYQRALLLNPLLPNLRLKLARIYADNGMYDDAKTQCEFLVMHHSDDVDIMRQVKDITDDIFTTELYNFSHGKL